MLSHLSSLLLLGIRASHGLREEYNGCVFSLEDSNGVTATYNLSQFHLTDETFSVTDDSVIDFRYEFNICDRIPSSQWKLDSIIPSYCRTAAGSLSDPCLSINTSTVPNTCSVSFDFFAANKSIPASAVQINENTGSCNWLGSELPNPSTSTNNNKNTYLPEIDYNISLIDAADGASGIKYSILNGAWCAEAGVNRALIIDFVCPDSNRDFFNPKDEIRINETVVEYPTCVYSLTYESPLACPQECIVTIDDTSDTIVANGELVEYTVCNGRGVCLTDPNAGKVRCVCDEGWSGDDCTSSSNSNSAGDTTVEKKKDDGNQTVLTALVICVVLLVGTVIVVIYLNYRVRKKLDDNSKEVEDALQDSGHVGARAVEPSGRRDSVSFSGSTARRIGGYLARKLGYLKDNKDRKGSRGRGASAREEKFVEVGNVGNDDMNAPQMGQDYVQFESETEESMSKSHDGRVAQPIIPGDELDDGNISNAEED